jgi:hypothetical protein
MIPKSYRLSGFLVDDENKSENYDGNEPMKTNEVDDSLTSYESSDGEDFDIEDATLRLFSKLFISVFENNNHQICLATGKIFITKEQFHNHIKTFGDED